MRKLTVFNNVSIDGYFTDQNGDMSWAHKDDPEWTAFTSDNARGDAALVFGRITYEMMASYWPTPQAFEANRTVAEQMTTLPKIVFSRSLDRVTWANTTVVKGDIVAEMRALKASPGPDMVIFGSGTIVSQFTEARMIDEFQLVVSPLVLGRGRTLFAGVTKRFDLHLDKSRAFANGNVVLWYTPVS